MSFLRISVRLGADFFPPAFAGDFFVAVPAEPFAAAISPDSLLVRFGSQGLSDPPATIVLDRASSLFR